MVTEEAREEAQELGCEVKPKAVLGVIERLSGFLKPFRKLFGRRENGEHAERYIKGRLMQIDRRTTEPIARRSGIPRRSLQQFVGAGPWEDTRVRGELREHIAGEIGDPEGALIVDASGFRKYGPHSVGTARQYCGNLGKVENCQVGEFVAYATAKGTVLVDADLYLPKNWARDRGRRAAAGVPRDVRFQKGWQLALNGLDRCRADLPHRWVLADDQYGRVIQFRDGLHNRGEAYVLDVPSDTRVFRADGKPTRVDRLARSLPDDAFLRVATRDGTKGPIDVDAYRERVTPVRDERRQGPLRPEILLIVRHPDGRFSYHLSNAEHVPTASLAKAAAMRHYIEEVFETGKGDAGMAEYEMRCWAGWHHHMTLTMMAIWFLLVEARRQKRGLSPSPSPWCDTPQQSFSAPRA